MAFEFRNTSLAFYPGGRPYNNKDFRVLQQLVLDTTSFFQAFTNVNAGEFIISGCSNLGDEGFVWLGTYDIDPDLNDRKLRYVEPWVGAPLSYPCYIGESNSSQTRTYKDGQVKDVFIVSTAYWSQSIPGSGVYITFNNAGDFTNFKLETTFASIGASYWTQVPATSNIQFSLGDVGIGTTNPISIGGGYTTTDIRGTTGGGIAMGITGTPIGYVYTDATNGLQIQSQAYPTLFRVDGTERMRITTAGLVGIGTNLPTTLLDVRGNMRLGDGVSAEQDILFSNSIGTWEVGTNNSGNGTSNNHFFFYDSTYRLTIQRGTGNVGIGTATPAYKMDVQGTFRSTGLSTFDAGISVGSGGATIVGTTAITGALSATTGITSGGTISVTSGNISVASGTITASSNISSGGTVSGSLLTGGTLQIGGTGTFGGGVTLTTGNLTLSSGNITISGTGTGSDWIATSDIILKENITTIDNALDITMLLQGHKYNLKNNKKLHYGFVAQEMEQIVPELVEIVDPVTNLKGVNYDKVSAILVEAIKEQQKIINGLNDRLQKLESKNI